MVNFTLCPISPAILSYSMMITKHGATSRRTCLPKTITGFIKARKDTIFKRAFHHIKIRNFVWLIKWYQNYCYKVCTWHDNWTVMACAKIITNFIASKTNFPSICNCEGKRHHGKINHRVEMDSDVNFDFTNHQKRIKLMAFGGTKRLHY